MPQHHLMFVNLPVADLARSRAFFTQLGYPFEEDFCDDDALCLRLGPTLYAMLLRRELFDGFHDRRNAPPGTVETLLCLSTDSREDVDALADRAVLAGGLGVRTEDHGFMYGRSYSDPDGHIWEVMWMDPLAAGGGPQAVAGDSVGTGRGPARAEHRLEGEMR